MSDLLNGGGGGASKPPRPSPAPTPGPAPPGSQPPGSRNSSSGDDAPREDPGGGANQQGTPCTECGTINYHGGERCSACAKQSLNDQLRQRTQGRTRPDADAPSGAQAKQALQTNRGPQADQSASRAGQVKDVAKAGAKELTDTRNDAQRVKEAAQQGKGAMAQEAAMQAVGKGARIATNLAGGSDMLGKKAEALGRMVTQWGIGIAAMVIPIVSMLLVISLILGFAAMSGAAPVDKQHANAAKYVSKEALDAFKKAERTYRVPWTLFASISQLATENGKFSPYPDDIIDRAPNRPGLRRPSAGQQGAVAGIGGGSVQVFGDSLCEPGVAQDALGGALARAGWQATFDCVRGRATLEGVALMGGQPNLGENVIVSLGTNDAGTLTSPGRSSAEMGALLDDAMTKAGTTRRVFWVNVATDQPGAATINEALTAAAGRHPNLRVVDMASVIAADRSLQAGDGLHLTTAGYTKRADAIAAALAGGIATVSSPANPAGVPVSDFPVVKPAIGGRDGQAVGPYLIQPGEVAALGFDAQDMSSRASSATATPQTATDYIGWKLNRLRTELRQEGMTYNERDAQAQTAFWTAAVARLPVVDPTRAACTWSGAPVGADAAQIGAAIQVLWRCELSATTDLQTLRDGPDAKPLPLATAVETLLSEAAAVSWAFSGWKPNLACATTPENEPAGIFPLTMEVFNKYALASDLGRGRCEPIANIHTAARALIAGERVKPGSRVSGARTIGDRSKDTGPYNPMIGGWWAMPWALGDQVHIQDIITRGPATWVASEACRAAVDSWAIQAAERAGPFEGVSAATLVNNRAAADAGAAALDYPKLSGQPACAGTPPGSLERLVNARTSELGSSLLSGGGAGDAAPTNQTIVSQLGDMSRRLGVEVLRSRLTGIGAYYDLVGRQIQAATQAAQRPGVDTVISRLSPMGITVTPPPAAPVGVTPYAQRVTQFAIAIGGIIYRDPRFDPNKDPYALLSATSLAIGGTIPGVPPIAMDAYTRAAASVGRLSEGCVVPVPLIAAFGFIESGHGTSGGAQADAQGNLRPPILGPVLNGNGTGLVRDTDNGTLDGDTTYDRAVGFTQFIPSTWAADGQDGNGDGVKDPQNVYDGALATAWLICKNTGGQPGDQERLRAMIYQYGGSSWAYVDKVMAKYDEYKASYSAAGALQTAVGPDGCPTAAPEHGDQTRKGIDISDVCARSVAGARTPQAANAIKYALTHLGFEYSQPLRNTPDHYDCSSFYSRAYEETGLPIISKYNGGWPLVTWSFVPGTGRAKFQDFAIPIPMDQAQPGDAVLTADIEHMAMKLVDGLIAEAPGTGNWTRVKEQWWQDGRAAWIDPSRV